MTPEQLLGRVASGDRDAYAELYHQLAPATQAMLSAQLSSAPHLVDEAMQETWLRVWRHARRYDAKLGPAIAWIISIARNEARRQIGRRAQTVELSDESAAGSVELIEMDELPERLRSLPLDDLDLRICYLAFYLDHTQAEMAQLLELPLGTIKGRMRRILRVLKEHLDD
jgi:RNA polymerase sigma-70 factor (ECF subfamily)